MARFKTKKKKKSKKKVMKVKMPKRRRQRRSDSRRVISTLIALGVGIPLALGAIRSLSRVGTSTTVK